VVAGFAAAWALDAGHRVFQRRGNGFCICRGPLNDMEMIPDRKNAAGRHLEYKARCVLGMTVRRAEFRNAVGIAIHPLKTGELCGLGQ